MGPVRRCEASRVGGRKLAWGGSSSVIPCNLKPSRQDGMIRQQLIEQLMREIMNYDAEYRREDAAGGIGVSRTALVLAPRNKAVAFSIIKAARGRADPRGTLDGPGWSKVKKEDPPRNMEHLQNPP